MICRNCGSEIPDTAKFCPKCGAKVEMEKTPEPKIQGDIVICRRCGESNFLTARFCKRCGAPLKEKVAPVFIKEGTKRPTKRWVWITTICGLILVIVGIGSYLYFSGSYQLILEWIGKKQNEIISPSESVVTPSPEKPSEPLKEKEAEVTQPEVKTPPNIPPPSLTVSKQRPKEKIIKKPKTEIPPPKVYQPTSPSINTSLPLPKVDPAKLEGDINRALRNAGLGSVTAEVNDNLEVTLKGSVMSQHEKEKAFEITNRFKEVKRIKDKIFVIQQ
jgi:ribosomal protein L40E